MVAQVMPHWMVASYAAVYVGVAQAAVDAAVAHVTERAVGRLPAVRARIGRADAAVAAARLAVLEAARRVDEAPGEPETNRWVWRAKLLAGETAMEVAASMLEAAGTSATRRGHPLERIFRDARCGSLQPATSDVCADWLGLAALGGDPDNDARCRGGERRDPGAALAHPPAVRQDQLWDGFFAGTTTGGPVARRIFASPGSAPARLRSTRCRGRLGLVDGRRMRRYPPRRCRWARRRSTRRWPTPGWPPTRSGCSRCARAPAT